jgi:hypothetical protein
MELLKAIKQEGGGGGFAVAANDGKAVFGAAGLRYEGGHIQDREAEGSGFLEFGVIRQGVLPYNDQVQLRGNPLRVPPYPLGQKPRL